MNLLYPVLPDTPTTGRDDLVAVLLTGVPGLNFTGRPAGRPAAAEHGDPRRLRSPNRSVRSRATSRASRTGGGSPTTSPTSRSARSRAATARSWPGRSGSATCRRTTRVGDGVDANENDVPVGVPVRRRAEPRLRAHGAQVGGARGSAWDARTALLVGGAIAVALALGGLVGGVLAESPSAGIAAGRSRGARRAGARGSGGRRRRRRRRRARGSRSRAAPARRRSSSRSSGSRTSSAGGRRATPRFLPRSEAALRRALRAPAGRGECRPRARLARAHPARVPRGARVRPAARAAAARARRARSASSATRSSSSAGTTRPSPRSSGWSRSGRASRRMRGSRTRASSIGDREGALAAMRLALDAAGGQPEPTAWAHVELAKLELASGGSARAARHVRAALTRLPGYPAARVELARDRGCARAARRARRRRRGARPTPCRRPARLAARRSARPLGPARARPAAASDRRRHRPAARGERRPGRPRVGRLPRRPRIRPAETVELARRARADAAVDLRRRRRSRGRSPGPAAATRR